MLIKDLTMQFAAFFARKDADAIGTLLADDFALFDPALKWVRGKQNVVELLKKQFRETEYVSYETIRAFQDKNVGVLEFQITLDKLVLDGVDFMHWENGKMIELRCYYNPPQPVINETLKPYSQRAQSVQPGAIYEHYKGKQYKILSVARHSETLEEMVIYQALYGEQDVWSRPLNMFFDTVVVDGQARPRFVIIS